jgi:hypothetical protein
MDLLRDLVSKTSYLSVAGLIVYSLVAFVAVAFSLQQVQFEFRTSLVFGFLASAFNAIAWMGKRRLPRFADDEVGIVVALGCAGSIADQDAVRGTLDALVTHLMQEAESTRRGSTRIRVRRLPSHAQIGNDATAERMLDRMRGVCLIRADATAGNIAGQQGIDLGVVRFLVRHRALSPEHSAALLRDLQLVHHPLRNYRVMLQNDVIDVATVSRNLAIVSKYQLALALAASGHATFQFNCWNSACRWTLRSCRTRPSRAAWLRT